MNAEETDITFDSEAGIKAARLYQRFADEGGMDLYNDTAARQAFASGKLGIYIDSSSYLTRVQEAVGDRFDVQLRRFIVAAEDESDVYFPTGGSAAVMLTEDPEKQDAAWEYMTFATGPIGAKIVVQNTGYAPTNATVLQDDKYLGDFYDEHPNARRAHAQVAEFSGPWYAYPGPEGVAVTDQIAAALVDVVEGADPEARVKQLADNVRGKLNMN
jgi:multiple sugar transport system substrate-binding protein